MRQWNRRRLGGHPYIETCTIVTLCVLGAASPCAAQGWTVGLRTGLNANRMHYEDEAASSIVQPTPGFHLGAQAGVMVTGILELEAGILYTGKGFDSDDEKLELAYLELPLLLSLRWPVALTPRVFAGPVVSFEVGCKSTRVPGLGELGCDEALVSLQREQTDIGLALGGGIGFGAGPGFLFLDVWVNQGLRDINQESRPQGWVRNQALLISLGYEYALGGGR